MENSTPVPSIWPASPPLTGHLFRFLTTSPIPRLGFQPSHVGQTCGCGFNDWRRYCKVYIFAKNGRCRRLRLQHPQGLRCLLVGGTGSARAGRISHTLNAFSMAPEPPPVPSDLQQGTIPTTSHAEPAWFGAGCRSSSWSSPRNLFVAIDTG